MTRVFVTLILSYHSSHQGARLVDFEGTGESQAEEVLVEAARLLRIPATGAL
jgi:hypothetical protein